MHALGGPLLAVRFAKMNVKLKAELNRLSLCRWK